MTESMTGLQSSTPPVRLDGEARSAFERDGVIRVAGVVDQAQMATMLAAVDR